MVCVRQIIQVWSYSVIERKKRNMKYNFICKLCQLIFFLNDEKFFKIY